VTTGNGVQRLRRLAASLTPSRRADAVCLLILVGSVLFLRVPSLERVALNPDESQYAATASYLIEERLSSFALPHIGGGGVWVYRLVAEAFGPYAMLPVRVLVMLVCLAVTLLLYFVVRAATSSWAGLLSALVFAHYNLAFEGLSANREWFAVLLLMGGAAGYARSLGRENRRACWWLFGAGLANGLALAFKLQAIYVSGAILVLLAWLALVQRRLRPEGPRLLAHAAGLAAGGSLYLLAFLLAGSLGEYLPFILAGWRDYVQPDAGASSVSILHRLGELSFWFYARLPERSMALLAYALALLAATGMALRALGRWRNIPPLLANPVVLLFTLYLGGSMLSIRMGGRYFDHYYLFLVLPLAALFGFAVESLMTRASGATRLLSLVVVGLLLLDLGLTLAGARALNAPSSCSVCSNRSRRRPGFSARWPGFRSSSSWSGPRRHRPHRTCPTATGVSRNSSSRSTRGVDPPTGCSFGVGHPRSTP